MPGYVIEIGSIVLMRVVCSVAEFSSFKNISNDFIVIYLRGKHSIDKIWHRLS